MSQKTNFEASILGGLVADAATLGLHWIYDVKRIQEVVSKTGSPAFVPIDPANYLGVPAYFAHASRQDGMLTQYGETLRLGLESMSRNKSVFDVRSYQKAYADFFGAGGNYQGYIDRPTRGTLANLTNEQQPSGIDDDQLPATTLLPLIVCSNLGSADLDDKVQQAMEITNVNALALSYGKVFTHLLSLILDNMELRSALRLATESADEMIRTPLIDALETPETNSVAYGEITQRACHLPMASPLIFHILNNTSSYQEAVETNIKAGGDNAGRSILIGAIAGASFGFSTVNGIPLGWVLKMKDADEIWQSIQALFQES